MACHRNKILFVKCKDPSCCTAFRSNAAKEHFRGVVQFPSPSESKVYKGRYNTFLQEELNQDKQFGDEGQLTATASNLGKCKHCPAFSFK